MSQGAYATFASVFALITLGHALLALTKGQRARRLRTSQERPTDERPQHLVEVFPRTADRASFNYLAAASVFFAGVSAYCAYLA